MLRAIAALRERHARTYTLIVRAVLCLLLVGGCFGSMDANGRPAVIPKLSAMPAEPEKRDAVLDQSTQTQGPETGKALTKKERKAVTAAAFASAIVGSMFSKSASVTFGAATTIDENHLIEKPKSRHAADGPNADGSGTGSNATPVASEPVQLVPWVNLHPDH